MEALSTAALLDPRSPVVLRSLVETAWLLGDFALASRWNERLTALPGVGRKTANVVLGHALGVPGIPVDRHVLRAACRQLAAWQAGGNCDLRMAVNISPRHLQSPEIAAFATEVLEESGVDPRSLELELTEDAALQPTEQLATNIQALVDLGAAPPAHDCGCL